MIIKLTQRGNGQQLSRHLESSENEIVTIVDNCGTLSKSINGVLCEFNGIAKASMATKHLAHCIISPHPDEVMDKQKWARAWQLFEEEHGLCRQPKIIIEHKKSGRTHQHAVYTRINATNGTAINLSHTHRTNEYIARNLELEFNHKLIKGKHNKAVINKLKIRHMYEQIGKLEHFAHSQTPQALFTHVEHQYEKRGLPLKETRSYAAAAWLDSKLSNNLIADLAYRGFLVAQGEKLPIMVSKSGHEYPLLRTINSGLKNKNMPRITKLELDRLLPDNLLKIKNANLYFEKHIAFLKEQNNKSNNSITAFDNQENDKWRKYQYELMNTHFSEDIAKQLSRFWKIYPLKNGGMMLQNNTGRIFDRGNLIESHIPNDEIAAKTVVKIAIDRWSVIEVNGTDNFKLAVYKQARNKNLKVHISNIKDQELWNILELASINKPYKKLIKKPEQSLTF